ncbi:MAG TPA: hypothetical protein VMK12_29895 [Anaeromyxobacteraceae bacterium]|nr:hypothetical protein [Anaeromyxobacteraceae bacterium]
MALYRFGKHPPKHDYRTLRFKNYLKPGLAPPPPSYDVLQRVFANLKMSDPTVLFPMDGNDTLGDCTIAGLAHAVTTYRGMIDKELVPRKQAVVKLYMHLTGGIDSGLNELDVLNYWRKHPFAGDKALAFVSIDPKNQVHVQQAIQMFGGVYLGFQVQQNCIQDFEARRTWTPAPLTNEGHAVFAVAYDPNAVTVLTWGNTQTGTWDWWNECVDEAYAILPQDAKDSEFAKGFNFAQLETDLEAVAA